MFENENAHTKMKVYGERHVSKMKMHTRKSKCMERGMFQK